ncbi:MAG: 4-hydroxy-tetrahydrodipicolinate synthase [Caedibacter sp. 38-128]|nr:4-hydroxy-tetrahydrodipicolinate synthase [Holosporales bacterium]OJX03842.1 MAG: 4-hydroxy-tetrahydrodipicolinate synthase [Caedibacter sp. 38-128]
MFKGSLVALITPFKDNQIDFDALTHLVEWHVQEGTHGIVVCGTTGEFSSLTPQEQRQILSTCIKAAQGKLPIIAGINAFDVKNAIDLISQAQEAGAQGVMVVNPPYIKPTQEGLYAFFKAIHDQTNLPLIIYNNPGRTGTLITPPTLVRLSTCARIVAVKDSSGDLLAPLELRRLAAENFTQLCGEDPMTVAFLAHGGQGCISVTANVAPRLCADLYLAWEKNDFERVSYIRDRLAPLNKALFIEGNPVPIKYAASLLGLCRNEVRSPLLPASENACTAVREALEYADLIPTKATTRKESHG